MNDIIFLLIETMENVEREFSNHSGKIKKEQVLTILKTIITGRWGEEYWIKYKSILPMLIDFIIQVSKNDVVLHLNEVVKRRFCHPFR
jgi:hypothetical protein